MSAAKGPVPMMMAKGSFISAEILRARGTEFSK